MADEVEARVAALPIWSGRVEPKPLSGGLSNRNYLIEDAGRRFVVRVGRDNIRHGVVRANEIAASRAAHLAGLSPAIFHAEPGLVVFDFIDGHTFTPEDVRNPVHLNRLVDLVRRCHRDIPKHLRGPVAMFWVFHVVRDYAHTLYETGSRYAPALDDLLLCAKRLNEAVGSIEVVFGHNDLLAANFIDDGAKLWLIDWEYSGFNSPLFDLAGLTSNSEMLPDQTEALLTAYYDNSPDDELRHRVRAMTAASLLRETMWSMVSELYPAASGFDYAAYTAENLSRFKAAYEHFMRSR